MPTTTNYIWDEENLLAEADGSNAIQTVYTNEPEQYGNLVSSRLPVGGTPTTVYHHFDALGSTRQLTNAAGSVTDAAIHDAWGNVVARTGTTPVAFLWVGELEYYYDFETAKAYVRERIYQPAIGRWASRDPLHSEILAPYLYARNMTLVLTDASGLRCRGKPSGSDYVSGRGVFRTVTLHGSATANEFGVAFRASWRPTSKTSFLDGCDCCCNQVAFIQVVKCTVEYDNPIFTWLNATFVCNGAWQVDAPSNSVLYPGQTTSNPCNYDPANPIVGLASMPDDPFFASGGFLYRLLSGRMDFETCVVCEKGNEGFRLTPTEGAGYTAQIIAGVTVYGCIKWGFDYSTNHGWLLNRTPFSVEMGTERGGDRIDDEPGGNSSVDFDRLVIARSAY